MMMSWFGLARPSGAHCHCLAAANQLRAACAKAPPAPPDFVGRAAGHRAIPTLHRMNCPAIPNALVVDRHSRNRLRQWRVRPADNRVFARKLYAQRCNVLAEIFHSFERRDARKVCKLGHNL